ncbi:MAG: TetR/AcrR family transcriptional regulator [Emcibacter sp.]|nr:TetR/AcrR family transcriptional regulator [Emcibacter sp.]
MGRQQRYDRTESVEKAMNLFWRNGFSGTSMRDLGECLDMRPGSIYANFGNKEQLYRESMDLYAANIFHDFQYYMKNADTFMEGLENFIRHILFDQDIPSVCMLTKTLADINPDHEALKEKSGHMISGFECLIITELDRAKAGGQINDNCDTISLARYILIQFIGLRSYAEMQKSQAVINELLHDMCTAIQNKAQKN